METFIKIFNDNHMTLPTSQKAFTRIQKLKLSNSIEFDLDCESVTFLEGKFSQLGIETINGPTLKKIAEAVLITNNKYHGVTHVPWIDYLNEPTYRRRPSSFINIPIPIPTVVSSLKGGENND